MTAATAATALEALRLKAESGAPAARYAYARALLAEGAPDEAAAVLEALGRLPDVAPTVLFVLGVAEHRRGRHDEAADAFRRALERQPERNDWALWLARTRFAAQDTAGAVAALEGVVERDPGNAGAVLMLTRGYLQQERFEDALALARRPLPGLEEDDPRAAHLRGMADRAEALRGRRHAVVGLEALRAGEAEAAIDELERALEFVPDRAAWRVSLAKARLAGGDAVGARDDLLEAIDSPDAAAPWLGLLGTVEIKLGDAEAAVETLRRAVERDPEQPAWKARLAAVLLAAGRPDEAADAYRQALKLAGAPLSWRVGLARALAAGGDLEGARDEIARVAGAAGTPDWTYRLGQAEHRLGRRTEAIAAYRRAIAEAGPEAPPSWSGPLASLLVLEGEGDAAAQVLEAATARPEATPALIAALARLRWRGGDAAGALELLERALLAEPNPPPGWTAMAAEIRARLQDGADGSAATSPTFYDAVYRTSPAYALPPEQSVYLPVWRLVAERTKASGARRVLDIGCGPGQFAEYLLREVSHLDYTGVDFSGVAIEQARRRAPAGRFVQGDLSADGIAGLDYDLVIALEVLEHVDEDLELLRSVRRGVTLLASVPNFDAFGHVRYFRDAEAVRAHYAPAVRIEAVEPVALGPHSTIYLLEGRVG